MEEILSSIKRIIAEEGEAPGRHRRQPPRVGAPSNSLASAVDEVLELSDPMPATPAAAELSRRAKAIEAEPAPAQASQGPDWSSEPARKVEDEEVPMRSRPGTKPAEPAESLSLPTAQTPPEPGSAASEEAIVSRQTADVSRGALESLSRLVVRPEAGGDGTLEGLVREMLRPMLRDWLDQNLPAMVETMVAREIARITQPRS